MYHRVTGHLVLNPGTDTEVTDFSRPIALGDDTSVVYEVWLVSKSGTIDLVEVTLQGSNDASNWSTLTTLTFGDLGPPTPVSAPDYGRKEVTSPIPWALVRLKYVVTTAATASIQLRAAIETFKLA